MLGPIGGIEPRNPLVRTGRWHLGIGHLWISSGAIELH